MIRQPVPASTKEKSKSLNRWYNFCNLVKNAPSHPATNSAGNESRPGCSAPTGLTASTGIGPDCHRMASRLGQGGEC